MMAARSPSMADGTRASGMTAPSSAPASMTERATGSSHPRLAVDPNGSPIPMPYRSITKLGGGSAVAVTVTLTPFAGFSVAHAELDGFTESDPQKTGAALKISGSDADSVATVLGLRFNGRWGAFRPQVAVGWEHEFEDTFQTVNVSFAGAPSGSNFKVIGTDLDEDAVVVDAGGAYPLDPPATSRCGTSVAGWKTTTRNQSWVASPGSGVRRLWSKDFCDT